MVSPWVSSDAAQARAEGRHDPALCAGLPGASAHVATGAVVKSGPRPFWMNQYR